MARKSAIPVTEEQTAEWQAERQAQFQAEADESTQAFLQAVLKTAREQARQEAAAAVLAAKPVKGEAAGPSRKSRGLGQATVQALTAAIVLVADRYGRDDFPGRQATMARAIADTAAATGITAAEAPLKHTSSQVKDVAAAVLHAVRLMDEREARESKA
jgi:hypothetical protein